MNKCPNNVLRELQLKTHWRVEVIWTSSIWIVDLNSTHKEIWELDL